MGETPCATKSELLKDVQVAMLPKGRLAGLDFKPLSDEIYREYDIPGRKELYRIEYPVALYVGATTHRVLDVTGVVHCIPFPGHGVVLRWRPRDEADPVQF